MYNKLYFNHVMKTGGRYFKENILLPILPILQKNNIKLIPDNYIENNKIGKHFGWISDIDDQTYVISILRDPVEVAVSLYTHPFVFDLNAQPKPYKKDGLDKINFLNNYQTLEKSYNIQSKHFLYSENYTNNQIFLSMLTNTNLSDINTVISRINRVNLLFKTKDLVNNSQKIQDKILSDLGIEERISVSQKDFKYFNLESKLLYEQLTDEEKNNILSLNEIDNLIYKKANFLYFEDSDCYICGAEGKYFDFVNAFAVSVCRKHLNMESSS
ncbi:MAG: hypothetical protein RLZ52_606 [Pseudomonadota bacterium]